MSYKTISTLQFDPAHVRQTLEAPLALARRCGAHLTVVAPAIFRTDATYLTPGGHPVLDAAMRDSAEEEARAVREAVSGRMAAEVIPWNIDDRIVASAALSTAIAEAVRFSDLLVVPAPYGKYGSPYLAAAVEAALFSARVPVLVIPDGGNAPEASAKIVLAWNESDEALHATRAALPLMKSSPKTQVVAIDPPKNGGQRSDPGGAVASFLSRHGAKADILVLPGTGKKIADMINRRAIEEGAGMIVMGAYGHTRMREAIFGGTTRQMLESPAVPVLMAH